MKDNEGTPPVQVVKQHWPSEEAQAQEPITGSYTITRADVKAIDAKIGANWHPGVFQKVAIAATVAGALAAIHVAQTPTASTKTIVLAAAEAALGFIGSFMALSSGGTRAAGENK